VVEIAAVEASADGPRLTSLVRWQRGAGGEPLFGWSDAASAWMTAATADAGVAMRR
jgi:hypothetical protein